MIAALYSGTRTLPARVLGKSERIHVSESSGMWTHQFELHLGTTDSAGHVVDSLTVAVGQNEFDVLRVGAHTKINRVPLAPRLSFISDSASRLRTLRDFAEARWHATSSPDAVSTADVQMAGLARVVAVHYIELGNSKTAGSSDRSNWIHLVEVEFWAPRTRNLVRTIDVIDAGSMPGLHPGEILQMHFDQRNPRVLRLDDGMRTFARKSSR